MAISLLAVGFALPAGTTLAQSKSGPPGPDASIHTREIPAPMPSAPPGMTAFELPASGPLSAPAPMDAFQDKQPKVMPEELEYMSIKEIPGLEILTRLETEAQVKERWIQKAMKAGEKLPFPAEVVLAKEPYPGRFWAPKVKLVEPNFVVHDRLYFEQPNLERGLWDLGIVTPVVSVGKFFWDLALLPYQCGTRPCQKYDTSAGKCLPGDPTPFYLYPPELSLTGLAAEGAALAGGYFIFP
ncbi:MAG TPA: hypothetical protein VE988_04485 [Gemmataceae bacterium]|nr:hypothetical protein [Gemmataceae bacterium]